MNLFLIIATIIANVIAVTIIYQILKKQPKKEILIFIAAGVTIIYLIISFVYWLSGFGISESIHQSSKNFIIYLFVPINVILFMPYIAVQYKQIRQNRKIEKYDLEKLSTKVAIVIMIWIAVSIGEFFYFRNIQNNIKTISDENNKNNVIENTTVNEYTNNITNEYTNDAVNESIDGMQNKLNEV